MAEVSKKSSRSKSSRSRSSRSSSSISPGSYGSYFTVDEAIKNAFFIDRNFFDNKLFNIYHIGVSKESAQIKFLFYFSIIYKCKFMYKFLKHNLDSLEYYYKLVDGIKKDKKDKKNLLYYKVKKPLADVYYNFKFNMNVITDILNINDIKDKNFNINNEIINEFIYIGKSYFKNIKRRYEHIILYDRLNFKRKNREMFDKINKVITKINKKEIPNKYDNNYYITFKSFIERHKNLFKYFKDKYKFKNTTYLYDDIIKDRYYNLNKYIILYPSDFKTYFGDVINYLKKITSNKKFEIMDDTLKGIMPKDLVKMIHSFDKKEDFIDEENILN